MADSALSRDHKLHRRHKQRLQKMLDVSEEAAYQLVESGSPTILGTAPMLVPTRAMVLALVDCAKLAGCTGFTSIGSGGSALECLLSYYFSGNVVAVDVAAEVFRLDNTVIYGIEINTFAQQVCRVSACTTAAETCSATCLLGNR